MSRILLEDVFKKSGVPTHTFVRPTEYPRLLVALRTSGRGVVVEGPSGIGKTSAITKVLSELGLADKAQMLSGRRKEDVSRISSIPTTKDHGLIVIDDFHRLPDATKKALADHMKLLADDEDETSKLVVVGINRAGDSLLRFAEDISGRIDVIKFEHNPENRIRDLITLGERTMNCRIAEGDQIVTESQGSFNIAQTLCHEACVAANVLDARVEVVEITTGIEVIRERVLDELSTRFFAIARDFATGPKLYRAGRAPYLHILNWLAQSDDWTISFDDALNLHPEQKASVGQVVSKGLLQKFLQDNQYLSNLIHYDPISSVIAVEDPKFVFFLRHLGWKRFSKQIGYLSTHFDSKYDVALSFAGTDRDVAEAIFNELQDRQFAAFYDKNEQHMILAQDVEEYLAPIYRSEAQFVIVLLGKDYSKRLWTKFESQQFKQRFGRNAVIPVWFSDVPVGLFDETTRYGGATIDRSSELLPQVKSFCDTIMAKFSELRREAAAEDN